MDFTSPPSIKPLLFYQKPPTPPLTPHGVGVAHYFERSWLIFKKTSHVDSYLCGPISDSSCFHKISFRSLSVEKKKKKKFLVYSTGRERTFSVPLSLPLAAAEKKEKKSKKAKISRSLEILREEIEFFLVSWKTQITRTEQGRGESGNPQLDFRGISSSSSLRSSPM